MSLIKAKVKTVQKDDHPEYTDPIVALILMRRLQILVHSCLYYYMSANLITDYAWTELALELVQLQKDYPDKAALVRYAKDFEDFDGSTGFDLPYMDSRIYATARRLLAYDVELKRGVVNSPKPTRFKLKGGT